MPENMRFFELYDPNPSLRRFFRRGAFVAVATRLRACRNDEKEWRRKKRAARYLYVVEGVSTIFCMSITSFARAGRVGGFAPVVVTPRRRVDGGDGQAVAAVPAGYSLCGVFVYAG